MIHEAEGCGLVRERKAVLVDTQRNDTLLGFAADIELEQLDEGQELGVGGGGVFLFHFLPGFEQGTDFSVSGHGSSSVQMLIVWARPRLPIPPCGGFARAEGLCAASSACKKTR